MSRDVVCPCPAKVAAGEFQKLPAEYSDSHRYPIYIRRNPVGAVFVESRVQSMKSFPDFEGVLRIGDIPIPFVSDAKVISGSALKDVAGSSSTFSQIRYMMVKAAFGELAGFLIHFNRREMKTEDVPQGTFWFPVHPSMEAWKRVERGESSSISREQVEDEGFAVQWVSRAGTAKAMPDLYPVLVQVADIWFNLPDPVVQKRGWNTEFNRRKSDERRKKRAADIAERAVGADPVMEIDGGPAEEAVELGGGCLPEELAWNVGSDGGEADGGSSAELGGSGDDGDLDGEGADSEQ